VTPEIGELLDKARDCLARARIILAAGVGEDAGRDAYLAGFHAAQAVHPAHQQRGHTARQRPPNNLEAPGLPSKGRAPRHAVVATPA
jgi:hypothetical protein